MLVDRNLMSHTYDFARFQAALTSVRSRYLPVQILNFPRLHFAQRSIGAGS